MVNLRRWVSPQRILSVAEEQKISDPGAPLGEHTKPMFSLDGFALSSVPPELHTFGGFVRAGRVSVLVSVVSVGLWGH